MAACLIPPTFLKRTEEEARALAKRVIKPETSEKMRFLMRLNAEIGTARKADVKGYYIGGKTGTAEKVVNGRYAKKRVLTAFTAIIPADKPRYQLLIMLDEPQPLKETYGFITSGWNAVPTAGNVDQPASGRFWASSRVSTCRRLTALFLRHPEQRSKP